MKLKIDKTSIGYQLQEAVYQAWEKAAKENKWDKKLVKPEDIVVEHPEVEKFGDYSCNLAMVLAPKLKQSPMPIAQAISKTLKLLVSKTLIDFVKVDNPGFINISVKKDYFISQLNKVLKQGDNYGQSEGLKGKKIMVEFAHPNTHKAFHIGHFRNVSTGESLVRLLQVVGTKVIRANYQGDVGMHIAKCLYGLTQDRDYKSKISKAKTLKQKVKLISEAYVLGTRAYEDDEIAAKKIKDINYLVYASAQKYQQKKHKIEPSSTDYLSFVPGKKDELDIVYDLWVKTRDWSLEQFEHIYKRVYSHFDRYYFESECLVGVDEAKKALKKGILKKSKGAVVFDGSKYDLDTRVFINSLGLPTYEGKELGLAPKELSEFGHIDRIIHVVTPEQASFFQVTFKVEELLGWQKNQQYHLAYEWVKLKKGKMSSRVGNIILGEWLLDEVKAKIVKKFPDLDEETAEIIAVGAAKYSVLKQGVYTPIKFDIDESISIQGNSGPYLQYTYARCKSVLAKSPIFKSIIAPADYQPNKEELSILRWIYRFSEAVQKAAGDYAPNTICTYLYELAQRYNTFYNKHKILEDPLEKPTPKSSIKDVRDLLVFRLALTQASAQVIKNGLYLLGIKAPEKM